MAIGDRIKTTYEDFTWPANNTGLEFHDLSIPWGHGVANWPYFEDVKIERLHYMAKSRVLTQRITTVMHSTTHVDVPAHVIENTPFLDEIPLHCFFGTGVVVSIPKGKWETVTAADLEAAARPRDPTRRHRDRQHRLASHVRRQQHVLCVLPRLLRRCWRVVRQARSQSGRHRYASARPSARDRDRTARSRRARTDCFPGPARSTSKRPVAGCSRTFRCGSPAIDTCCPTASSGSRTWVATSTPSPGIASRSPRFRGDG